VIILSNDLSKEIYNKLKSKIPKKWDGKESIIYMKNNGSPHWRQMEWIGFYFQFMCESILRENNFMDIPGNSFGKVEFDGFKTIDFDFKAHAKSKKTNDGVPTNNYDAILESINLNGKIGFIIASGDVIYDDNDEDFKKWHDNLKGKTSKYVTDRINRNAPSRRRKVSFDLDELIFVYLDKNTLSNTGSFQKDMRNSNGNKRNEKVMIDLNNTNIQLKRFKF
jgi:hypothetical protein